MIGADYEDDPRLPEGIRESRRRRRERGDTVAPHGIPDEALDQYQARQQQRAESGAMTEPSNQAEIQWLYNQRNNGGYVPPVGTVPQGGGQVSEETVRDRMRGGWGFGNDFGPGAHNSVLNLPMDERVPAIAARPNSTYADPEAAERLQLQQRAQELQQDRAAPPPAQGRGFNAPSTTPPPINAGHPGGYGEVPTGYLEDRSRRRRYGYANMHPQQDMDITVEQYLEDQQNGVGTGGPFDVPMAPAQYTPQVGANWMGESAVARDADGDRKYEVQDGNLVPTDKFRQDSQAAVDNVRRRQWIRKQMERYGDKPDSNGDFLTHEDLGLAYDELGPAGAHELLIEPRRSIDESRRGEAVAQRALQEDKARRMGVGLGQVVLADSMMQMDPNAPVPDLMAAHALAPNMGFGNAAVAWQKGQMDQEAAQAATEAAAQATPQGQVESLLKGKTANGEGMAALSQAANVLVTNDESGSLTYDRAWLSLANRMLPEVRESVQSGTLANNPDHELFFKEYAMQLNASSPDKAHAAYEKWLTAFGLQDSPELMAKWENYTGNNARDSWGDWWSSWGYE